MKYLIIVQLAIAITSNGVSQISEDLLKTYKNQDLQIRQLNLNGSLNGGNSNSDFLYQFNGGANYSQFLNKLHLQSDFFGNISYTNTKTRDTYYSDSPIAVTNRIQLNGYKKARYYSKENFFFGLGYELYYSFNTSSLDQFINTNRTEKHIDHFGYLKIPLSVGIGRKYPVYSIHKSNWIYSELQRNQCLNRTVTEIEIEQMAHLLDENVYIRYFDYRYKSIQDLSRVDSLLRIQNIVNEQNIVYFTTLYDMYYYSSGANRYRGNSIEAGIRPQFFYSYNKTTTTTDSAENIFKFELKTLRPLFFVEYQKFKPINQYWQMDYSLRGEYGLKSVLKDDENLTPDYDLKSIEAKAILSHYPNTRTKFTASLTLLYGNKYSGVNDPYYLDYYNDSFSYFQLSNFPTYILTASHEADNFYSRLSLQHYYYINPQLRLQSGCSFTYSEDSPIVNNRNKLIFSFGTSISYALF